jgi:hypothetical protein
MNDPAVWLELRSAFQQLAIEYGDRLKPSWRSTPRNDVGDHWYVYRSDPNDDDRERSLFISLAKRAGVYLGGGGQADPLFAWLDHLRIKSAYFKGGHSKGQGWEFEFGTIERPCAASVCCCYDLETEAMARPPQEVLTLGNDDPRSRNEDRARKPALRDTKSDGIDKATDSSTQLFESTPGGGIFKDLLAPSAAPEHVRPATPGSIAAVPAESVERVETGVKASPSDSREIAEYLQILQAALDGHGWTIPQLANKIREILKSTGQNRQKADRATIYRIMRGATKRPQPALRNALIKALALEDDQALRVVRALGASGIDLQLAKSRKS